MLINQTVDNLRVLKLHGMTAAFEQQTESASLQSLSFEERFSLIVDSEVHDRRDRRQLRLLRAAKLKQPTASIEDIDYLAARGLDRSKISSLTTCDWIGRYQNLIITGSTGVGKTWLGCAFAQQALRKGNSVLYYRMTRLVEDLEICRGDGSLPKLREKIAKAKLLLIDDWALSPLSATGRQDLMEIIEDRSGAGSMIITSQLPIAQWHEYIGEPTLADAILDRVLHRSHRLELRGDSMRKHLGLGGDK
jgi:DNA replication protein DnaC